MDQINFFRRTLFLLIAFAQQVSNSTKALDSLKLSRMWLGKLAGAQGQPYPYKEDGSSPPADIVGTVFPSVEEALKGFIENGWQVPNSEVASNGSVVKLREQLGTVIASLEQLRPKVPKQARYAALALQCAEEAKMWLGVELSERHVWQTAPQEEGDFGTHEPHKEDPVGQAAGPDEPPKEAPAEQAPPAKKGKKK